MALGLALGLAAPACRRAAEVKAGPELSPPPPVQTPYASTLAEGDRAFAERDDPERLGAALSAFARATAERPGDAAAELRLARAEAFRALAQVEPARARESWQASARAAERALRRLAPGWAEAVDRGDEPAAAAARVDGPGAEALYLLGQGALRSAQGTGYAALLSVKDAVLAMLTRAAELDERVDAAGPHRALGGLRAGLPVAAGGGAAAARAHFDRARALAPDDLLARVAEAETLAVLLQDGARFDALLGEVRAFDLSRDPDRAPENRLARRRAEELARQRARLF
jgi:hypothetical protein